MSPELAISACYQPTMHVPWRCKYVQVTCSARVTHPPPTHAPSRWLPLACRVSGNEPLVLPCPPVADPRAEVRQRKRWKQCTGITSLPTCFRTYPPRILSLLPNDSATGTVRLQLPLQPQLTQDSFCTISRPRCTRLIRAKRHSSWRPRKATQMWKPPRLRAPYLRKHLPTIPPPPRTNNPLLGCARTGASGGGCSSFVSSAARSYTRSTTASSLMWLRYVTKPNPRDTFVDETMNRLTLGNWY